MRCAGAHLLGARLLGLRLLGVHLRPHRGALLRLAGWSAVEAAPTFFSGLVLARALDQGFLAGRPEAGFAWLGALACLWIVSAMGTRQVYPWLAATVEPLRDSLLTSVVDATLRRAVRGEENGGGSAVSQATEQVEAVRALGSTVLRTLRQLVSSGVAALAGLALLSPRVAVVVAGFVAVALAGFGVLLPMLVARYRRVVVCGERVGAVADPVVAGVRDVITLAAEPRARDDIGTAVEEQAESLRAFARAQVWRLPVIAVGVYLPLLTLLAFAPWLVAEGHLSVGEVAGGVVYLSAGLQPAVQTLVNAGSTLMVSLAVVLGRLASVVELPGAPTSTPSPAVPRGHRLELDQVTFGYSEHGVPVIDSLTLDVDEGTHLAVVGPSGTGKSTLANLLVRMLEPQRGEIRLGGVPLGHIGERHLHELVTLIPQEAYVFTGSLRENLCYLRPDASAGDLDAAAAAVGLEALLARLGGYGGHLPPGGGDLSPGERQLIALARVYLSPAKVIVLDEATCHLDPVAEGRAERAFAERPGTLIVVAHRISSALRAQRILLMDGPDVVPGTHEELLNTSARYAELVGHWRA